MKTDFRRMEEEMDRLATNMDSIADFSAKISCTLQERREQISRLSGTHSLLKKVFREHPLNQEINFSAMKMIMIGVAVSVPRTK